METAKDRNCYLKQIENACENLTSQNDDFMFVTMNTHSKTSHCVGTQIGMDFLNQQLMVDSGESSILKMFSKFVKDHYGGEEIEYKTEQKIYTKLSENVNVDTSSIEMRNVENDKLDLSPTELIQTELMEQESSENKTLSFSNNIVAETETVAQKEAATESYEKAPQSEKENCLSASQEASSLFTHIPEQFDDEPELCSDLSDRKIETVCKTVRRIGRPKKEDKARITDNELRKTQELQKTVETLDEQISTIDKKLTNKTGKKSTDIKTPKSSKTSAVLTSRSGRKVVLPKWLQEDFQEVEIKKEPEDLDDSYGGLHVSKSNVDKDTLVKAGSRSSRQKLKQEMIDNFSSAGEKTIGKKKSFDKEPDKKFAKNQFKTGSVKKPDQQEPGQIQQGRGIKRKFEDSNEINGDQIGDSLEPDKSKMMKKDFELHDVDDEEEIEKVGNVKVLKEDSNNKERSRGTFEKGEKLEEDNENDESILYDAIIGSNSDGENEENEIKDDDEDDGEVDGDESDTKEDTGENTKQSSGRWSCGVCNAKAKKCWLVRRHMRRMHDLGNDDFKPCRHCRRVLANEECNRCLVKEEKNFMCDTCGSVFTTKAQLSRHEEVHLTEKEVPCPLCNKKFKTERYVKMHVYNTHKKRYGKALSAQTEPGICDICGKWFRFKCNAVRHREIHFEEKKFDCSICQMKFRHSSSLKRHMMSHQQKSDNMYVCEQCGRSFKMRQTLLQHHRVHVKQPFLKCEYCPREFRTYKGKKYHILKDHIDKAGEFSFKSYICEHCGKPSSSQNEYEEHLKNHDESRTHVCSICGTRWETVAQLKAHKKKHNVTPFRYRCKVCNIPFKEASKVRAHIQKDSHFKNCAAKGLDRTIDKVSDLTNTEIVEIIEYDYELNFRSEEDLQLEIEASTTAEIHEMPDEIKVIHIEQNEFDVTGGQTVQILNEEGVEIMYDEISLPQEEITVDGNQVIYQVEIDGQNAIICDTLTSQAVESILKLQSQA
ncbi:zinc finger protein 37-like [Mytilus trossulus]|uniref:zinc finger protein 37-like n=1 Tax=Mytilus trossulus TaxID=6551 RepID=UPI0030041342